MEAREGEWKRVKDVNCIFRRVKLDRTLVSVNVKLDRTLARNENTGAYRDVKGVNCIFRRVNLDRILVSVINVNCIFRRVNLDRTLVSVNVNLDRTFARNENTGAYSDVKDVNCIFRRVNLDRTLVSVINVNCIFRRVSLDRSSGTRTPEHIVMWGYNCCHNHEDVSASVVAPCACKKPSFGFFLSSCSAVISSFEE